MVIVYIVLLCYCIYLLYYSWAWTIIDILYDCPYTRLKIICFLLFMRPHISEKVGWLNNLRSCQYYEVFAMPFYIQKPIAMQIAMIYQIYRQNITLYFKIMQRASA